jgi:hypothetical protein
MEQRAHGDKEKRGADCSTPRFLNGGINKGVAAKA